MRTVNEVRLLGNIGRDPDVRATGTTTVANLSLATTERYKVNGEWKEHAEWHYLVAFGRTAEIIKDYVRKGSKLYVAGRLQTRSWEDADGNAQRRTEILVDEISLLSTSADSQSSKKGPKKGSNTAPDGTEITDDDIPF